MTRSAPCRSVEDRRPEFFRGAAADRPWFVSGGRSWKGRRGPGALFLILCLNMWAEFAAADRLLADDGPTSGTGQADTRMMRDAVSRAIPLLEQGSAGSAKERQCFTCHNQAVPVLALVAARDAGFCVDAGNLERQIRHTAAHLERGRDDYREGRGQGGKVLTAGYALWTLDVGGYSPDELTSAVAGYVLDDQRETGHWEHRGSRPPSSGSDFTATYVALRALRHFGPADRSDQTAKRRQVVLDWLLRTHSEETEDHVFRLRAISEVGMEVVPKIATEIATEIKTEIVPEIATEIKTEIVPEIATEIKTEIVPEIATEIEAVQDSDGESLIQDAVLDLLARQRTDGGWAQKDDMPSDAYATGTVLAVLLQDGGMDSGNAFVARGIQYLLRTQCADGSWHVRTRAEPFQTYFESGFPHGPDQFLSMAATGWCVVALVEALPGRAVNRTETDP